VLQRPWQKFCFDGFLPVCGAADPAVEQVHDSAVSRTSQK
jgi:hypothetical protein